MWGPAHFLASSPKISDPGMWGCNKIIRAGRNGFHSCAFAIEMKQLLDVRLEAQAPIGMGKPFLPTLACAGVTQSYERAETVFIDGSLPKE